MDGRGATGRRRALTLGPVTCLGGGEEGPTVTARVNPRSHVRFLFYDKVSNTEGLVRLPDNDKGRQTTVSNSSVFALRP